MEDSDPDGWEDIEFPRLRLLAVDSPDVRAFFERDLAERLRTVYHHALSDPRYTADHEVFGPEGYVRFLNRCAAAGGEVRRVAEAEKLKFAPALRRRPHVHWVAAADAPRLSAERHLPILYVFTATWCGACEEMQGEVFSDRRRTR